MQTALPRSLRPAKGGKQPSGGMTDVIKFDLVHIYPASKSTIIDVVANDLNKS